MNDTTAQPHPEELEQLRRILTPLGDKGDRLIAMLPEYLENVSPITWCAGQTEPGEEPEAVIWQLGQPSPLDATRIVFAIFHDVALGMCVAYSFTAVALDGKAIGAYFREFIFRPRYATGPIALEALYEDLKAYLTLVDEEPDDEPRRRNGA